LAVDVWHGDFTGTVIFRTSPQGARKPEMVGQIEEDSGRAFDFDKN